MGYRKKQTGGGRKRGSAAYSDPYFQRWKYLKKYVKQMVFVRTFTELISMFN